MQTLNPAIERLINNFSSQLVTLTKELALETLEDSLKGVGMGWSSPTRLLPVARVPRQLGPAPKRPRRVLRAAPQTKGLYLPDVSSDTKEKVRAALARMEAPVTSKALADHIADMGETTVRIALKHLVNEQAAKRTNQGKTVLYERAT